MSGASLDVKGFDEVAVVFIDEDGYPFSYPSSYRVEGGEIIVERPGYVKPPEHPLLVFNHITPLPAGGYTNRRYLAVRCRLKGSDGVLRLKPVGSYGWDESKTHFIQYCEMNVERGLKYLEELGSKLGRRMKPSVSGLSLMLRATRLPFLIATVVPVLLGASVAAYHGYFDPLLFVLTLVGASSIHLGLNMANDYFDSMLGADYVNKAPTPFSGGSRVIQYGLLSPASVIRISGLFYLIGVSVGLYLAVTRGFLEITSLLAIGFFLSFFYTAPPVKLAYRGLGELAVGVGFGPVIVLGSYFVQAQAFEVSALLASIPVGVLIALILYVNEIPDKPFDKAAGKKTVVVRLSDDKVLLLYKVLLAATYALIVLLVASRLAPLTALIALVTIPLAVKTYKEVRESYGDPYRMIPGLADNIKLTTLTGLLLGVGYGVAAATNWLLGYALL